MTGGGTGIGAAIAQRLALSGDDVIILGRRPEPLAATAEKINAAAGTPRVRWHAADLADPDQVAAAVEAIIAPGEAVDILVNNAGGNFVPSPRADLAGMRADWLANLTGNVLPVVLITAAVLPAMRRPGGRIVTVTSVAAFRGPASYGGAKAALHPWSAELAVKLAPEGITVNVVAPGYVMDTEFYGARMTPEFHRSRVERAPARRGATPDEVAATVAHLADASAGFITGQIIQINGGQLLGRG
ncbi:SDR family oxidoreductase [Sorangium sp. So ce1000]